MEAYRSGHNEPHSKCGCPQGHVGSNPTASAKKPVNKCVYRLFSKSLIGLRSIIYSTLCHIFFVSSSADGNNQILITHLLCNCVCSCSFNIEQFHNFSFCYLFVFGNKIEN